MTPLLPLLLAGLAPTVAVLLGVGKGSQIAWLLSKVWLLAIPLYWHLRIDRKEWSWSTPEKGGFRIAALLGLGMSGFILLTFLLFGDRLDSQQLKDALEPLGLMNPRLYFAAALYWIFVNSVLEEYVFRWFLVTKAEELLGDEHRAIVLGALIFVLHHTIAMAIFGFPWWANILASLGLFIGGAVFSWLYLKYRSIWVPWLAHAICDVAVFGLGALLLLT